jgi:hypothetical protein
VSLARVTIQRPVVLLALVGLTAAAFAGAGMSVSRLNADRALSGASAPVLEAADEVALALDAGPWISEAPEAAAGIWALAPLACETCPQFHAVTVARLAGAQQGLRVLAFPGADASPEEGVLAARFAKARDWTAYRAFAENRTLEATGGVGLDPDEAEGFALWARASAERLAGMGVAIDQPTILWRTSQGWRMLSGAAALDAGATQRAIALDLASLRP